MSVEFVRGAVSPDQFPTDGLAEIAFVGRSNVGKSSLLNALLVHGQKQQRLDGEKRAPDCFSRTRTGLPSGKAQTRTVPSLELVTICVSAGEKAMLLTLFL
jgi:GTPase SAR1 family protein